MGHAALPLALLLLAAAAPALGGPPIAPPSPDGGAGEGGARFQDWAVSCDGGCHAFIRLISRAPGEPEVLRLAVTPAGKDTFSLTLRTPAPLYLPEPAVLTPDRGEPFPMPWFTCDPRGCEARLTVGSAVIRTLRAGQAATVTLALADGSRARLALSLRGFTAALEAAAQGTPD